MKYEFTDGSKVFFTSDTHFGHVHLRKSITGSDAFIVEQCCRPTQYEVGVDLNGYHPVSFQNLKERIKYQIKNKCNVINWLDYE